MGIQPLKHIGLRIKALRNIQGLTQEGLALKAGIAYASLTKIESGVIKNPSLYIIDRIAKALEVQIENLLDQTSIVKILSGRDCVSKLLDDVYFSLKDGKGEVYISGIDERKFLAADKESIEAHISRLTKAGIHEKLLAREGDVKFFPGPQSIYRWVPESMFNPTPIYVYGNKIAMVIWGPPQQVIIIENFFLADAYRKQFLFIWDRAIIPPVKNIVIDEKARLERIIINRFGGRVSELTSKDKKIFRDYLTRDKTKTYGNSFYYLCQAANGIGHEKIGLKYFDGEMLASIGIFNRSSFGGGWHFHINHPIGVFNEEKILTLAQVMMELSGHPVYVKKISKKQRDSLVNIGFSKIETYPWHIQALEEDDTFPEQIIDIQKNIDLLTLPGQDDAKDKYHRFISKFGKMIKANDFDTVNNASDADMIINNFFNYLENKNLKISERTDFDNFINCLPLGSIGKHYFSQVLYMDKKPCAFFAAEPISKDTAGLYANISLHEEYPYLSEYLIFHICQLLAKKGYKYLNLGGSETAGLFQFKDKFSPVEYNKMHWVVYKI